jgi:hypothetical protein
LLFKGLDKVIDVIETDSSGYFGYCILRRFYQLATLFNPILNQVTVRSHMDAFFEASSGLRNAQMGYIHRCEAFRRAAMAKMAKQ